MKRILFATVALWSLPALTVAQDHGPVEVSPEVKHDTLPSLRSAVPQPDGYSRWHVRDEHMLPLPYTPPGQVDGALQNFAARSPFAPTFLTGVDGVGNGFTGPQGSFTVQYAPPDTVGAIGATQFVQVVNVGLAVFDKTDKHVVYGPVPTNTLWSGFGGSCEADNDGDAVVVYDKAANRWVVSQFAVVSAPYFQCVAVSQTSDATGAWNRYAFSYGSPFPDYPKMGVWPDAYYETFNIFNGNTFGGSKLCAYDRAAMLAGAAATQQCFQLSTSFGGVLPSDLDGASAPPANAPNYMINFGTNSLNLWKFHVDWANTANTTLSSPVNIPVAAFTPACNEGACVPQPGTHQSLDSLADRVMFRLAYRNFGDHESLVVNQSVKVGTAKANPYTGVRWYEIRSPGSATPLVYQQSTFSPDTNYRWMGSIAMDGQGNIALGYSVSSGSVFPAVRYTGRLAGDTLSTMQAETSIFEGSGSQSGSNLDRWGDYSAMTIDPVDDCTFWYTNEYLMTTGAFNWSTRIGSLKFPGCGPKVAQTITFANPGPKTFSPSGTFSAGATASSGLTVSYTSNSPSICTVADSTITIVTAGDCSISADQPGDATYSAAPTVTDHITINPASQSITFSNPGPKTFSPGGTFSLGATASSGLSVGYVSNATSVCTVAGSTVTIVSAGDCSVTASQTGNGNYNAAPTVTDDITINPASQSISFTNPGPKVYSPGGTFSLGATASSGLSVSYVSNATSVCTVAGATVTIVSAGDCSITASQAGDGNYNAASTVTDDITINPASQSISFTNPGPKVYSPGGTFSLGATATSGLSVGYTSNTTSVCTVSGSTVTIVTAGDCSISANQAGDGNYNAATPVTDHITINPADQTVGFDSSAPGAAVAGGSAYQVLASATSGLAASLAIDATTTAVCQLDGSVSSSHVTFIGAGTCKINATQTGNGNYNAATPVQQSFTVGPGPAAVLVFTTQPSAVIAGNVLTMIAVTEEDAFGDVIDDSVSIVDFAVPACGGDAFLGSATMSHGVATLSTTQRFYTTTDPSTLQVAAQSGALSGTSQGFVVQANGFLLLADGFEGCRL